MPEINWAKLENEWNEPDEARIIYRWETSGYEGTPAAQRHDVLDAYAVIQVDWPSDGMSTYLVWGYVAHRDEWVKAQSAGPLVAHLLGLIPALRSDQNA